MNRQTARIASLFNPATPAELDHVRDIVTDATLDLWHLGGPTTEWSDTIRTPDDLAAIDWDALRDRMDATPVYELRANGWHP